MALLVGALLALAVGLLATGVGLDRDRAFYPTVTIVIASSYALFAVMGASTHALVLESLAGTGFLLVAVLGFRSSLWLVAVALAAHGIFDLVHGMVISNPDIVGTFEKVMTPEIMDESTLQDLFELRLVLEMGIADLLFIHKTEKDLDELEEIAAREMKDNNFRISNEIAFHSKLYEMTGNNTLKRFQSLLLPIFGYVIKLEKKKVISGKVTHQDLVKILRKGTVEDFKEGMLSHLQPHFERVKNFKK